MRSYPSTSSYSFIPTFHLLCSLLACTNLHSTLLFSSHPLRCPSPSHPTPTDLVLHLQNVLHNPVNLLHTETWHNVPKANTEQHSQLMYYRIVFTYTTSHRLQDCVDVQKSRDQMLPWKHSSTLIVMEFSTLSSPQIELQMVTILPHYTHTHGLSRTNSISMSSAFSPNRICKREGERWLHDVTAWPPCKQQQSVLSIAQRECT